MTNKPQSLIMNTKEAYSENVKRVTIVATQLTFLRDTGHSHNNIYSNAKGLGNSFIITATHNLT